MYKRFRTGCNYWALNGGAEMWKRFDAEEIKKDMATLSAAGIDTIRVFPTWNDFQPIVPVYTEEGKLRDIIARDGALLDENGLDDCMLERFGILLDLAEEAGIEVIVGLLTGWMSGKLYVPEALYNKNVIMDSEALMWESRFVSGFVKRFMNRKSIIAWDLGNEGNCMAKINCAADAYLWTAVICGAIRREDTSRPIISGMHSLDADPNGKWTIKIQGELTDILTTHPYDYWVPYCLTDSIASMRAVMHSAAESRLYSSLGGKPCLVEEIGTMGPMICSDSAAEGFMTATLFNNWAEGFLGQLWWCAFDQSQLDFPPYDVMACERELGLFRTDRSAKPFAAKIHEFKNQLKESKIAALPAPKANALIVLTYDTECWPIALGAYLLAKQAGLQADFAYCDTKFKDYPLYILPSVKGNRVLPKARWNELIEKIKSGANLLITMDDCFLQPFESVTGVKVKNFYNREIAGNIYFDDIAIPIRHDRFYDMENTHSDALAKLDGNGVFFRHQLGYGKVFTLTLPIEKYIAKTPGVASDENGAHYKFYAEAAKDAVKSIYPNKDKLLSVTEHIDSDNSAYLVFINCGQNSLELPLVFNNGYKLDRILRGKVNNGSILLASMDAAIIKIVKKQF